MSLSDEPLGTDDFQAPGDTSLDRLDQKIYQSVSKVWTRLMKAGATEEEAATSSGNAYGEATEDAAARLADELVRTAPPMLEWHRSERDRLQSRLRTHWGDALDLYFTVTVCIEELGDTFNDSERPGAAKRQDLVFEALIRVHARACRTALEVHHLLSGGFPLGALARCRTLHELAVTALVITDYGRRPEHTDLANRFLLHQAAISYVDAKEYQERCEILGEEPFSDHEIADMKQIHDQLVTRFGTRYAKDNGWAAPLFGPTETCTFRKLEKLARLSHLRSHYRWECHEVHADAKGLELNDYRKDGRTYRSTGVVNVGLAEPGHLALMSLQQCTVALLLGGTGEASPRPSSLVSLIALQRLVDDAGDALAMGQASVDHAQQHYQATRPDHAADEAQ